MIPLLRSSKPSTSNGFEVAQCAFGNAEGHDGMEALEAHSISQPSATIQSSYASHEMIWTSPGDEMNGHAFLGAPRPWSIIAVAFQRLCVAVRKVSDNTSFDNRSTSKGQTTALTKPSQVENS